MKRAHVQNNAIAIVAILFYVLFLAVTKAEGHAASASQNVVFTTKRFVDLSARLPVPAPAPAKRARGIVGLPPLEPVQWSFYNPVSTSA